MHLFPHLLEALLYLGQGATYAIAWWAIRQGGHAPGLVYLASSIIYMLLGLLGGVAVV
jgi:hypothetical protein